MIRKDGDGESMERGSGREGQTKEGWRMERGSDSISGGDDYGDYMRGGSLQIDHEWKPLWSLLRLILLFKIINLLTILSEQHTHGVAIVVHDKLSALQTLNLWFNCLLTHNYMVVSSHRVRIKQENPWQICFQKDSSWYIGCREEACFLSGNVRIISFKLMLFIQKHTQRFGLNIINFITNFGGRTSYRKMGKPGNFFFFFVSSH